MSCKITNQCSAFICTTAANVESVASVLPIVLTMARFQRVFF